MFFNGINFKDNTNYAYACAKVRALENKLLSRSDYLRILDLERDQIVQYLVEHDYTKMASNKDEVFLSEALSEQWEDTIQLVCEMLDREDYITVIRMRYDFLNLKILIKNSLRDEEEQEELKLFKYSNFSVEELLELYNEEKFDLLPEYLYEAIKEFDEQLEDKSPSAVDIIIDKIMYAKILEFAAKSENDFLVKYYARIIDLKNIINLFRLKSLKREFKDYQKIIMDGGIVDTSLLLKLYGEPFDMILNRLHFLDYYEQMKNGIEYYNAYHSLSEMERLFDNWLIEYVKVAKMISFGPEAVIGYYLAKENELKNLRIVLTGIENNLDKEMIVERLRENYV